MGTRFLEFKVNKQRLIKKEDCDFSFIVAGSAGYLRARFYFSEEWTGCNKAASFWIDDAEYAVLLDGNNECVIPKEALSGDLFSVSVTGMSGTAGNKYRITTNKIKVRQEV